MGEVTNEQVNLMLRLFEERRETRLREARNPGSNEAIRKVMAQMREATQTAKTQAAAG
jgi:hypothetical protein